MALDTGNGWDQKYVGYDEERKSQSHDVEKVPVQKIVRAVAL